MRREAQAVAKAQRQEALAVAKVMEPGGPGAEAMSITNNKTEDATMVTTVDAKETNVIRGSQITDTTMVTIVGARTVIDGILGKGVRSIEASDPWWVDDPWRD